MDTTTESPDLRALKSGREWFSYLTLENAEAVADRIRSMLEGRSYTWVSCNEGLRNYFPEVRTGQRLRDGVKSYRETLEDSRDMAGFTVCDTYGVWGLHTMIADQGEACKLSHGDRNLACIHIDPHYRHGGRIEIEHFAPVGARLYWVVAIEPRQDGTDG